MLFSLIDELEKVSDRHIMGGALRSGAPALVIDLSGGDVPVPEKLLHLTNIHPGT